MEIRVRGQHMEVDSFLKESVDQHLRSALSHIAGQIRSAEVLLADMNGPRGGVDKRCRILIRIVPTGAMVAQDEDADAHVAAARATDRVTQAVVRMLKQRWMGRRRTGPRWRG